MIRITSVTVGLLGALAGTTALTATLATGCGSSTGNTADSGMDTGGKNPIDSGSGKDGTSGDTSSTSDASDSGTKSDASDSGSTSDSPSDSGDAGACTTTLAKLGGSADAASADASGLDAADAAAPSSPALLFGFDGVTTGTTAPTGWSTYSQEATDAGFTFVLGSSATEGDTCPGSLSLSADITTFGEKVQAQFPYGNYSTGVGGLNWSHLTTLHASVKVTATADVYSAVHGVQLFVQSGGINYPDYLSSDSSFIHGSVLSDGMWHDLTLTLTPGTSYDPTEVDQIGVQIEGAPVFDQDAAVDAGTITFGTAVLYVDDIWVE
jgi:hypothetical protein